MAKTVIVTGANGYLGRAVTEKLHDEGYFIEAAVGPGKEFEFSGENCFTESANLLSEAEAYGYVTRVIDRSGRVDAAVLLVGGFAAGTLRETNAVLLDKMIDLNFRTAFHLVRPLLDHFEEEGGGHLVFIAAKPVFSAKAGRELFAYTLSKTMLVKMAELINAEPKKKNISAAVIAPSVIDTPPNRKAMPKEDFSKWVPPAKIADAIAFLLSEPGLMLHRPVLEIYNKV